MKQINKYTSPELVIFEKDLSVYTTSTTVDVSGYPDASSGSGGHTSSERPTGPSINGTNKSTSIQDYNPFQ